MTSFVGRRQATAGIKRALSNSRLVTLTGVGGVGKSRLALHVVGELRRAFPDGVSLVELAKMHDPAEVSSAVMAELGPLEQSARDDEAVLVDFLAGKRMLILLDNCEHVLEAAGRLAHTLLSAVPGLRVLATSQESLGIAAEHVWPVSPLTVPSSTWSGPEDLRRFEAVRLFEDRAAAVVPGFTVNADNAEAVVRLCQRLDGVPLALELAAVRVRMLSVEQILSRLERRFEVLTEGNRAALPRHQTLRAAVDWSYDLCTEQERVLWARCSVFAGDFDLDVAESVCSGDGLAEEEIFTGIAGLVDRSVLTREDHGSLVRYRMLETIRQYGAERLAEAGERDRVRRRHRDFYLRFAQQSDVDSHGPWQAEWAKRLRAEWPNLREALGYCLAAPGEVTDGLRLASALWLYWAGCGRVSDGRRWLERALAADPRPSRERARALWLNGWVAFLQGDNAASVGALTQACDLARQLEDETELTYAIQFLGGSETFAEHVDRAIPLLSDALSRHRRRGQWTTPALVIFPLLARIALLEDRLDDAADLLNEGKAICTAQGERWTLSWTSWNLAVLRWEMGQHAEAAAELDESLRIKAELDDQLGIPFCLELLAWVAIADDDPRRAAVLFGAAGRRWQAIGRPLFGFERMLDWHTQVVERTRTALGERAYRAAEQRGAQLSSREALAFAFGEDVTSPAAEPKPKAGSPALLTKRELQVATLVAAGQSNREIASSLVIAQRTAESHVDHIMRKLGFTSRTQIAVWLAKDEQA